MSRRSKAPTSSSSAFPVGVCGEVAREIAPHLKSGAIVSDVGSVKGSIVRDMGPHLPKTVHFVPAHPVAGTEHSGPDAGFAELFENRWCILTPPEGTDPQAVEKLAAFWRLLGANVERWRPIITIWCSPSPAICRI